MSDRTGKDSTVRLEEMEEDALYEVIVYDEREHKEVTRTARYTGEYSKSGVRMPGRAGTVDDEEWPAADVVQVYMEFEDGPKTRVTLDKIKGLAPTETETQSEQA